MEPSEIKLAPFDQVFFDSLNPADRAQILKPENAVFRTILVGGEKAGVVGYIPFRDEHREGFAQAIVLPAFRGHGIAGIADDLLAKEAGLIRLHVTITTTNIPSLHSIVRAGFTQVSEEKLTELRAQGKLNADQIRFTKEYIQRHA